MSDPPNRGQDATSAVADGDAASTAVQRADHVGRSTPPPLPGRIRETTSDSAVRPDTADEPAAWKAKEPHPRNESTPPIDATLVTAGPPPLPSNSQPLPRINTDVPRLGGSRRWLHKGAPWMVSLALHFGVGFLAAWLFFAVIEVVTEQVIVVGFADGDPAEGLEEMDSLSELEQLTEFDLSPTDLIAVADEVGPIAQQSATSLLNVSSVAVESEQMGDVPAGLLREVRQTNAGRPAEGQLRQAGSVEEAVDGIVGDIGQRLQEDDLLVAWLFDSSISLLDDRRRVAERLDGMFASIADASPTHKLMNTAIAFGGSTRTLVGPTSNGTRIVNAVRDVPIDRSGTENVMLSVKAVVEKYTRRWEHGVMVVVWTDESGDDVDRLEQVIGICRQREVAVSVVGPSSMLSRQTGIHAFHEPGSGQVFLLPIKRGPDTALPQRLHLPYWYRASLPGWTASGFVGPAMTDLPPWFGGPQMERLSSGFGPYSLTRLALATGGSFTVFDRAADRGPFNLKTMGPYRPDYRPLAKILADMQQHPLRQAISNVVAASQQTDALEAPETALFAARPQGPDGPKITLYYPPARFRDLLRGEMVRRKTRANEALVVLEKMLAVLGPDGMKEQYEHEPSPRWRAWYDLTRGRLLAMSVRQAEYAILAELLSRRGAVGPQTNHVLLTPSPGLRGPDAVRARAAEASLLLNRCMKENPHTPWAYLAQRELDHPFGIDIRQVTLPPPIPAAGVAPIGPAPQPSLPSL